MLISVILPVYNVSDYIEACLDSLLHQSIGQEKIEVILIDDCSTDDSVAKMRNYEQQFSHFKLYQCPVNLWHQENHVILVWLRNWRFSSLYGSG